MYSILNPLYNSDPGITVKHVAQFVQHNVKLGFNATILYERGRYIHELQAYHVTNTLIRKHHLMVCVFFAGKELLLKT